MAKPKLTKEAIAYIIKCRDNPTTIYTLEQIRDKVEEKFNIRVSVQAISQNYRKYKGNIEIEIKPDINSVTNVKKSTFKFNKKANKSEKTPLKGFDRNIGENIDIQDLLSTDD